MEHSVGYQYAAGDFSAAGVHTGEPVAGKSGGVTGSILPTGPAQRDGAFAPKAGGIHFRRPQNKREGDPAEWNIRWGINMLPAIFLPLGYIPVSQWLGSLVG
ncbi:hypothetical protein [uncultured Flavonifractor sp.]|nr:hypothetical protein [uncultured Flavonifractor sp.]